MCCVQVGPAHLATGPDGANVHVQASDRIYYVYQTLADAEDALRASEALPTGSGPEAVSQSSQGIAKAVEAALCDDLNTPQAVALLSEPLKTLNDLLHTKKVAVDVFITRHCAEANTALTSSILTARAQSCMQQYLYVLCVLVQPIIGLNVMQGKKAAGRLDSIRRLRGDIKSSLRLMGLDAEDSGDLLKDLRSAALIRSAHRLIAPKEPFCPGTQLLLSSFGHAGQA